jgi:SAM-dependent methyltransferase
MRLADFDGENPLCVFTVVACNDCGFAFNDLEAGPAQIEKFYSSNQLYPAQMGVGSGGMSAFDEQRYDDARKFMEPLLPRGRGSLIADIGCAKGGFLKFLQQHGYSNLLAVDLSSSMIDAIAREFRIAGKQGAAAELPCEGGSVDVLNYSNIFEHLYDVHAVASEAARVSAPDGLVVVEVPDAGRYAHSRIADYYWFSQCEHINHFDAGGLQSLFVKYGFARVASEHDMVYLGVDAPMPVVRMAFRRGSTPATPVDNRLEHALRQYIAHEEECLVQHRRKVDALRSAGTPVYIWGRGLELMCQYTEGGLGSCKIRCIIDNNPAKQGKTLEGLDVRSQESLAGAEASSAVVITSAIHKKSMMEHLRNIGYPGQVVCLV